MVARFPPECSCKNENDSLKFFKFVVSKKLRKSEVADQRKCIRHKGKQSISRYSSYSSVLISGRMLYLMIWLLPTVWTLQCPTDLCNCSDQSLEENPYGISFQCIFNHTEINVFHQINPTISLKVDNKVAVQRQFLGNFPWIHEVIANEIELEEIPEDVFDDITTLELVTFSDNKLAFLPMNLFDMNPYIWAIDLDGNRLTHFNPTLFPKPELLKRFFLGRNQLTNLTDDTFHNFPSLEWLFLNENSISHLPNRMLENNVHLSELYLNHNSISEIPELFFENSRSLQKLNLSHNQISQLHDGFSTGLLALRELDLSFNKLIFLPETAFVNLRRLMYLDLSRNHLKNIGYESFRSMKMLAHLKLSFNKLTLNNSFYVPSTILSLNLSFNLVQNIPLSIWENLTLLVDLDLRNNYIDFLNIEDLHFLYLSDKQKVQRKIHNRGQFRNIYFCAVYLQSNRIAYIDLQYEKVLLKVNNSVAGQSRLEHPVSIFIDDNPLHCDCQSIPLRRELTENNEGILPYKFVTDNLRCNVPLVLSGQRLIDVEESNLLCQNHISLCENECKCFQGPEGMKIDCEGSQLTVIPSLDHFLHVYYLNMGFTRISNLSPLANTSDWLDLKELRLRGIFQNSSQLILETKPFSKLWKLVRLDLSRNNFKRIPEDILDELQELTDLDLSFNRLTTITPFLFKNSHKLKKLNLEYNRISSVDNSAFLMLKNLQELYLSHNYLKTLPHAIANGNLSLKILELRFNLLNSLKDNISLSFLEELYLDNNKLDEISVQWPETLQYLSLKNNIIKEIQYVGLLPTGLRSLNLDSNKIESLNVSKFKTFENDVQVILTNNKIKTIRMPDKSFNNTVTKVITFVVNSNPLYCDCNLKSYVEQRIKPSQEIGVQFADDELFCNEPLFFKDFSVNDLIVDHLICESTIDCPKECECFRTTSKKNHHLICTRCQNDCLPKHTPSNVTKAIFEILQTSSLSMLAEKQWQNLSDIQIQTLSGTTLSFPPNIFENFKELNRLFISFCNFSFPVLSLANLSNLEILDVTYCKIEALTSEVFARTTNLMQIVLSNDGILEISEELFKNMNKLEFVDLSNNRLSSLGTDLFKNCWKLRVLKLEANDLTSLSPTIFNQCRKLTELNLSKNNFGYHEIRNLELESTSLQKLNLSHNSIEDIFYNWVTISTLNDIDFSFNRLKQISVSTLSKFPCGTKIHLQNNEIQRFLEKPTSDRCNQISNSRNIAVDVNNNPIICDCKLYEFFHLVIDQDSNSITFNVSDLYCAEPENLKGNNLIKVTDNDLICNQVCSQNCSCYSTVFSNVTNCTGQKLTHLPNINSFIPSALVLDNNENISIAGINESPWKRLEKFSLKNSKCIECKNKQTLSVILQSLKELRVLDLSNNEIAEIKSDTFATLKKLVVLNLSINNIKEIASNTFLENEDISSLDLSYNHISAIPQSLFQALFNLQHLSLSHNNLKELPEDLFNDLRLLKFLNLSFNELLTLPYNIFHQSLQLKILDLSHNRIHVTKNELFEIPPSMTHLNLSNNELTFVSDHSGIGLSFYRKGLENLDLSKNNITKFDLQQFLFRNNSHCSINLDGNFIEKFNISLRNGNVLQSWRSWLTISLNNNLGVCDCEIVKFRNRMTPKAEGNFTVLLNFTVPENFCTFQHHINIYDLIPGSQPFCNNIAGCPEPCRCSTILNTKTRILNCSHSGLYHLPQIDSFPVHILLADHNILTDISDLSNKHWRNLNYIDLSFNNIKSLPSKPFGENVSFIALQGNNLEKPTGWLNDYVTQSITPSFQMNLTDNPWFCDCDTLPFQTWLINNEKVKDVLKVTCSNGGGLLLNTDLCFRRTITILASVFTIVATCLIILIILYFRNKTAVHVWLYSHHICTCLVKEELIDQDKEFDAFISYSGEDRDFVFNDLAPGLEDEKPYFQLCIHERDWKVGEEILQQIDNSIETSRRIIFVVSKHFVESSWTSFEFRSAYHKTVMEKINRIIVVVLGDLPPKDQLDPDLRMHMSMNTYLQWGDPRFFDKLRYAMPKKKVERRQQTGEECFGDIQLEAQQIIHP